MAVAESALTPPCAKRPEAYMDERYHFPPDRSGLSQDEWDTLSAQMASVRRACASCPFLFDCLYRAVVEVDVFGYAACTTAQDRERIRAMLGIELHTSGTAFDAPDRIGKGPVDHEGVVAMRRSYPLDTFGELAARLGCSLSTVKRHLRRARDEDTCIQTPERRTPTVTEVLDCFDQLEASRCA